MTETDDAKSAPNATSTNSEKNQVPNDSNLLEIKLSLSVSVPKDEKKNLNKVERCGAVVYDFLRRIDGITLPPGKFETPYDFSLDFKDIISSEGFIVKVTLESCSSEFEANGLTCRYENDKLSISGTPKDPNGFDGNVQIQIIDGLFSDVKRFEKIAGKPTKYDFPVKSTFSISLPNKKFVLNPDPDSLWEDKPTPKDAPFQKDNEDRQSGSTATEPPLTVLGASQRGRSHAQIGSFRDDHFLIRLGENPDDWNFVAVADGAGSARFSREGSRIACEAWINDPKGGIATLYKSHQETLEQEINVLLCRVSSSSEVDFSSELAQTNLQKLFYYSVCYAWHAINNTSINAKAKLNDFNTTFLCAAFKRLPKTEQTPPRWIVLSYWVGDGGLAIFRPNGKNDVLALGTPDGGEFAGQTRFLTMKSELEEKSICERLRLAVVEDFQALVLATDGITDPFFPAEANLSDYVYWEKFWNETLPREFPGVLDASKTLEERGQALLSGLKFKSKGNHDDRTLVLVLNDAFGKQQEIKDETSVTEEKTQADERGAIIDVEGEDVLATIDGSMNGESSSGENNLPTTSPEDDAVENGGAEDEALSSVFSDGVTENSESDVESNSDERLESSVSQEGEVCAQTDSTCDTANKGEAPTSTVTLEKNENRAEVVTDESHVSKDLADELSPPDEIVPPVSETPAGELPPPPDEIVVNPVLEATDAKELPTFCS